MLFSRKSVPWEYTDTLVAAGVCIQAVFWWLLSVHMRPQGSEHVKSSLCADIMKSLGIEMVAATFHTKFYISFWILGNNSLWVLLALIYCFKVLSYSFFILWKTFYWYAIFQVYLSLQSSRISPEWLLNNHF